MSDEDQDQYYELRLRFDTDDPEFARGVEVGLTFQLLAYELQVACEVAVTIHTSNAEMMMRIAEAMNLTFSAEEVGGDLAVMTFRHINANEEQNGKPE